MNFYDAFISYGRPDSKAFAINLNEKFKYTVSAIAYNALM